MEEKYKALPKSSEEFEDVLIDFAEEHQQRGIASVSLKKKRKRNHIHSASRDSSEDGRRRHKRSRRSTDVNKDRSGNGFFHSLPFGVPPEMSGGKKRLYCIPETSAISEGEDDKPCEPFMKTDKCPVAVSEEEIITTSAIQEFCKDQSISDVSMTLVSLLDKATSIPATPKPKLNDLKEQGDDIILEFSKRSLLLTCCTGPANKVWIR